MSSLGTQASLVAQTVKMSACNAGDPGLIPGSGRSPGEGNGNPLQYSCLENPMDRGAWQATVHGVARVGHDLVTKPSNSKRLHIPTRSSFISTSVRTVMTGARGRCPLGHARGLCGPLELEEVPVARLRLAHPAF